MGLGDRDGVVGGEKAWLGSGGGTAAVGEPVLE